MLTADEEKFLVYWEAQRQNKKAFLKKFSISLPLLALIGVVFFANFLSGWFGKADKELRRHSSVLIVILIAVVAIVIFITIFSVHLKWDRSEADYQSLLNKKNIPALDNDINQP